MFHKNVIPADNHPLHSWLVADPVALAALVPVAADVGKVAIQTTPYAVYVLEEEVGPTWVPLSGGPGSSISIVDAGGYFVGTTVEDALQEVGASIAMVEVQCLAIACSDETTNLAAASNVITLHAPYKMEVLEVFAGLTAAQSAGSIFTVDINEAGTSILSTKITIDNTEETSLTAVTPPVISDATIDKGSKITVDIDQIGTAGAKGLKVYMIVRKIP